jgi:hypothetical protein
MIVLKFEYSGGLAVPLSYDASAVIGGRKILLGPLWVVQDGNSRTQGGSQVQASVDALDPSIRTADIVLTPNPRHIEHRPEVSKIWGEPTTLRKVPIERLDLEIPAAAEEAGQGEKKP